jgi:DNA-binding response OmpR family regulator
MSGDPEWAADHGIAPQQYVAKPFDLSNLVALVQATLDRAAPVNLL